MTITLTDHHYIAADQPDAVERQRLEALEATYDGVTRRRLARLGIGEDRDCLEVAAGAGSIAGWLGRLVGRGGRVVAADLDPRFLGHLAAPVEVRQFDLLADELEAEAFDLIHVRMLLMHLSDPAAAIAKLAAALRPGGRLCVEDYDTASIAPTDLGDPEALLWAGELRAGLESLREDGVMDCYLGRRHPELLRDAGLTAISGDGHAPLCRGRDDGARFMVMCADVLHSKGAIDAAQVERTRRLLADPSFRFVGGTLFGAWGRKPA